MKEITLWVCEICGKRYNSITEAEKCEAAHIKPNDWMERNKERILQAGTEGREIEFRIGGRLFTIREKAQ